MKTKPLFIDFETAYSSPFSLTTMTTEEYIRHSMFHIHMFAVQEGQTGTPYVVPGHDLQTWLADVRYPERMVVAHEATFDLGIIALREGQVPKFAGDTVSMSRWATGRNLPNHRLATVAESMLLPPKGTELALTKGLWELSPEQYKTLSDYCIHDVELCATIFQQLRSKCSAYAFDLIDWSIRLFLQPRLELDANLLTSAHDEEVQRKEHVLAALGVDGKDLRSRAKFRTILENLGVDVAGQGMKTSPVTGKETEAFAKVDPFMWGLLKHPLSGVREVTQARLDLSSSLLETRLLRLKGIAARGLWPVSLLFAGAQNTGRMSGGGKVNAQNLPRGSKLRQAVMAPEGYVLCVCDSSQIEVRTLADLAGQDDLLQIFVDKGDPYCMMASHIYGHPITKADKNERWVGKLCVLSCGYGCGVDRFLEIAHAEGVPASDDILRQAHATYRRTMSDIVHFWKTCDRAIQQVAFGTAPDGVLPDKFRIIQGEGIQLLPTGFIIKYPRLRRNAEGWCYGISGDVKMFGAKCTENLSQCIAGAIIGEQTRILRRRWDIKLQVHDELIAVVPEDQAEECLADMIDVMSTPPDWWPDLPLAAEGSYAVRYGDAK